MSTDVDVPVLPVEPPPCTCIATELRTFGERVPIRAVIVYSPFCPHGDHKERATYSGPPAPYEKGGA